MKVNSQLKILKSVCPAVIFLHVAGCAQMQRSPESGYANYSFESGEPSYLRSQSKENSHEALEFEKVRLLRELESQISSHAERIQYFEVESQFRDIDDKILYLRLKNKNKQAWLQSKGIDRKPAFDGQVQEIVDRGDIAIGMNRLAVTESWGEPDSRQTAGEPGLGKERWIYRSETPTPQGFVTKKKILYFEFGRVAGWNVK
ncbi:MAG: hypothetical protein COT74_06740 [Bdellovibrionales bacterium CG10_big_fil_rev_8_21_14_0_10_45_34]|nr:MAG: hypothetical protein COT74_06740 [Bdellovibrionales bacterium CG10_big_fil_rev_8_21_14_0_10_45_34]